jgi:hypothetical protein
MHKEILTPEQVRLLPLLQAVSKRFGLVGGTAVALHLGHRRSIDFDLFSYEPFDNTAVKRQVVKVAEITNTFVKHPGEYTFLCGVVKVTFFHYPYAIPYAEHLERIIKIPDLLTLAAMKAFALGKRAKWKDYVDLYFIMRDAHSFADIVRTGIELFGNEFNEKLFRVQLSYFDDINYSERVEFLPGHEVSEKTVKKTLTQLSIQ